MHSVVIIGSGNVATSLGTAFKQAGFSIKTVYSRNHVHALELAEKLGTHVTDRMDDLPADADLYLIAVKDEAIGTVAEQLKQVTGIVVHTSGSTPLSALNTHQRHGVFYGLQTFTKSTFSDLNHVPFLVEASSENDLRVLEQLAARFSTNVQAATTEQRQALHVAAVFANNFTNHLYAVSKALLDEHALSFDLLKPLILKTADNVMKGDPEKLQTGPAVRNDNNILSLHLQLLHRHPQWKEIYEVMSRSITSLQKKND